MLVRLVSYRLTFSPNSTVSSEAIVRYFISDQTVPVILLERHTAPLPVPKAHFLSPRSLEIFRQFGIPISDIRKFPTKRNDARWIRFVTDVNLSGGREIGVLPFDNVETEVLGISPEVSDSFLSLQRVLKIKILHNIPQPDLQNLIHKMLEKDGKVDIRKGWTWVSCSEASIVSSNICQADPIDR